jgi:hypothetical protein
MGLVVGSQLDRGSFPGCFHQPNGHAEKVAAELHRWLEIMCDGCRRNNFLLSMSNGASPRRGQA